MAARLRAGVIGAGVFGGYHAGKYAAAEGVTLQGVFDADPARTAALAGTLGVTPFASLAALLEAVDVITVATPAVAHAEGALAALRAGKPVYIEKPVATSLEDADKIVAEAAKRGLVAACGFQERVGFAAMGLFGLPEQPLLLEAVRLGTPGPRNLDVSVVVDLMIHDLDLALALTRAQPLAVEGEGAAPVNDSLDVVEAEATFDDGFTARFRASRIAEARERTMRLVFPSGEIKVDFLTHAFENTTPFALNAGFDDTPESRDKLAASVARFLAAVRGDAPGPLADAAAGARALDLALAVEQAAGG